MRPKIDFRTASYENYNKFCENNPKLNISFDTYKKILYRWNELLILHLIESGNIVKLPYGFGPLVITKYKPKKYVNIKGEEKSNFPINWQLTKEKGKIVRTLNMHTDGNKYYFAWLVKDAKIKSRSIWSFKIKREFSRLLSKKLMETPQLYKDKYREWIKK